MKYLKTYEKLTKKQLENKIIKWMKDNQIDKVDLANITEFDGVNWILISIFLNPDLKKRYDPYLIEASYDTRSHVCDLMGVWNIVTLQKILDYLNSLTKEQIELQKMKNEAEKFNI